MQIQNLLSFYKDARPLLVRASKWFFLPKGIKKAVAAIIIFMDEMQNRHPEAMASITRTVSESEINLS